MRHAQVKLVQGILWVKVLQNLEKDHQRHFPWSTTDTQVHVPCQQRIPWALPHTSNQSLLHVAAAAAVVVVVIIMWKTS
jgi:hypothetical protein